MAYKQGVTRFNTLEQVKEVLPQDRQGKTFVILMDYGACDVETIPDWDGSSVDGIRVTFHKKDMLPALEQCRRLKEKGYKTFLQPMVALRYTDAEYLELIRLANEVGPYAFYLVDSFGTMKRKDMLRFFYMIEHNLREDIVIGFHSHNNLQLAYANAQTLVDLQTSRSLILDSSIMGMGRGAGNLNSELFLEYLNDNAGGQYRVKPLLRVIDRVLNDFYQQNPVGITLCPTTFPPATTPTPTTPYSSRRRTPSRWRILIRSSTPWLRKSGAALTGPMPRSCTCSIWNGTGAGLPWPS